MPKIPTINSKELLKIAKAAGFVEVRQTGSHKIMYNKESNKTLPVPMHNKDLGKGLVRAIFNQMGLNTEDFLKLRDRM